MLPSTFYFNSFKKKKRVAKKFSSLWVQCETPGLIEDYVRKFHQEANESKLSEPWLAQLSENPMDCVCGQSLFAKQANFFSAVFSKQFFTRRELFKDDFQSALCSLGTLMFINIINSSLEVVFNYAVLTVNKVSVVLRRQERKLCLLSPMHAELTNKWLFINKIVFTKG